MSVCLVSAKQKEDSKVALSHALSLSLLVSALFCSALAFAGSVSEELGACSWSVPHSQWQTQRQSVKESMTPPKAPMHSSRSKITFFQPDLSQKASSRDEVNNGGRVEKEGGREARQGGREGGG